MLDRPRREDHTIGGSRHARRGYARLGQADEALSWLAEAAQNVEVTNERYHEAELHPLLLTAYFDESG